MIDRPWLFGRSFVLAPVAMGPSICSPCRRGLSVTPAQSDPSLPGTTGSAHLGFTDTAICSCPPKGTRRAQVNGHPLAFTRNRP